MVWRGCFPSRAPCLPIKVLKCWTDKCWEGNQQCWKVSWRKSALGYGAVVSDLSSYYLSPLPCCFLYPRPHHETHETQKHMEFCCWLPKASQSPNKHGQLIFHFPVPRPHPSQSCAPPNGLHFWRKAAVRALSVAVFNHNIRKVHKIMKANLPLSEKERLLSWKATLSTDITVFLFPLDNLFKYQRLKSPDNFVWSENKHLLSLIAGHFSHAKLDWDMHVKVRNESELIHC